MGTRADFYVGRGLDSEWIGSIAYDGYPDGQPEYVRRRRRESTYRAAVAVLERKVPSFTSPAQGWPWPWVDSATTDYAYAFDGGKVWVSCFGGPWFPAAGEQPEEDPQGEPKPTFPDMKNVQNVTLGPRSGILLVTR